MADIPTPSDLLAGYRQSITVNPKSWVTAHSPYELAYYQKLLMRAVATKMTQKALSEDGSHTGTPDEYLAVYIRVQELSRLEEVSAEEHESQIGRQDKWLSCPPPAFNPSVLKYRKYE